MKARARALADVVSHEAERSKRRRRSGFASHRILRSVPEITPQNMRDDDDDEEDGDNDDCDGYDYDDSSTSHHTKQQRTYICISASQICSRDCAGNYYPKSEWAFKDPCGNGRR